LVGFVSHPCHVSIGPDQDGSRSSDRADYGKLPYAKIFGIDQLNPIPPRVDVEAPGLLEIK
jgi:hypothetical protein